MNKIEIKVLNPEAIKESEKMIACGARLTQRGHKIKNMDDFMALYEKDYKGDLIKGLVKLPHPTLQKLGVINVAVVGASRRFLAQITRHQNEVKFVSASLQYSDYSDNNDFCVPYDIMEKGQKFIDFYINKCKAQMQEYEALTHYAIDHDAAGYMAPQGLRNILIISATPYQWKHIIRQRTCRRNTKEMEYIMLRIWEELMTLNEGIFGDSGPFCTYGKCQEGKMCCGKLMGIGARPSEILRKDFPLLYESEVEQ